MLSFGFARLPLTWRELLTRTIKEFVADNGLGLCRGAIFLRPLPAVLVGSAFASFFPLEHFVDRIVGTLGGIVPGGVIGILQDQVRKISEGGPGRSRTRCQVTSRPKCLPGLSVRIVRSGETVAVDTARPAQMPQDAADLLWNPSTRRTFHVPMVPTIGVDLTLHRPRGPRRQTLRCPKDYRRSLGQVSALSRPKRGFESR
jgi:hypothetical protein